MNRSLSVVPALFCLAAAVVTAQAPAGDKPANYPPATQKPATQQPATPRPTTPPSPSAQEPARPSDASTMAANKVTYTGCVKPGTTTGTWILENAEVAQTAGASSPSAVGTSGAAKVAFNLDPAATVNVKAHANHKVEVVGILSPAKTGTDTAATSVAGAQAPRQQFSVESLKMVSATCP